VAIQRVLISDFLERSAGHLILDVRSPGEYVHAHMPGAISFPLFTDEERKVVGTTYKQKSREEAIRIGLDYFGPKMRKMIEAVEEMLKDRQKDKGQDNQSKNVFLYCWRGGMRSAAIGWLLDLYGFKVTTLAGGYKAFRNHVLESFGREYQFKIVGGYTGSGKTEIIHTLKEIGEIVIDLEGIACHKGSAFGSFNMPKQPTQEMFENLLSLELIKKADKGNHIWLEDESQRIGNLNIPNSIWDNMRTSPIIFMEIPFEERLNHIEEGYGACDVEKLIDAVKRITKRLGPMETKTAIIFLEEGNKREAFRILLQYYDKRYLKGLRNREHISSLLKTVKCETVTNANALELSKYQTA
jgi:tRNA 2-selenouridine synthase